MTRDEVAIILGWERAGEDAAAERQVPWCPTSQTADGVACDLWVRLDRRSYPMDWAWLRPDQTPEELAEQMRFLNDLIERNETAVRVSDESRVWYRGLLDESHERAMRYARRR